MKIVSRSKWALILAAALPVLFARDASAQFFFGRNKIQYNQFNWHVMKTEHFDIYFYPEMEELARVGAGYAEEAYRALAAKFDQNIQRRIPLIFYSSHFHFQETNVVPYLIPEGVGGFFEFIKGRVVIPSNGSLSQFRHVIWHELVHVFTHSKLNRVMKDNKKLEGGNMPLWFVEGIAEYWSQGWDSQAEMVLRDAVLSGYLVPLTEMYQISGSFLMYKEGQAICRYIARRYGEIKLLQLFDNMWKGQRFELVLKETLGKNYREFDRDWLYSLKKQYYPLLKKEELPERVAPQITREGINTKPAFYHLNGKPYVVFYSNRTGYSNIYQLPLESEPGRRPKPQILIKGERTSEFESFHLLQSRLDVDAKGRLAFIAKSQGKDAIYIFDLRRKVILRKLQFSRLVFLSSPSWSPDGKRLVFSAIDFSGKNDLYITSLEDSSLVRLTNDLYDDRDPAWAPNGKWIAFSSDRTEKGEKGAYNLFLLDLDSGTISYITHGNHKDYTPSWSPDGKFLAFSSDRSGAFNLWVIRLGKRYPWQPVQLAGHSGLGESRRQRPHPVAYVTAVAGAVPPEYVLEPVQMKQVTHFVTGAFDPEWTDDGQLIFTAFENFNFQLQKLENVPEKFSSEPRLALDILSQKEPFWFKRSRFISQRTHALKYRRKYSLDLAQSYVTQDPIFGTYGGAQLAVSDILGNYQYYFLIYNTAQTKNEILKSLNVAVSRLDLTRRINLIYGVYHFAGRFFNYAEGFFYERRYGGFFGLSYPFSVFRRVEASVNVRNSEKEWFGSGYYRRALLISNFVSWVHDNSLWGPTGPMDGSRCLVTVGNTVDVRHSKVNFTTLILDFRRYFRLSRRVALATRTMGSFNIGKETVKFFMGGSWDLRGYRMWSLWGEKMVLFSEELRFPFIDRLAIRFPIGGVGFSSIRGALFWDNGNAWDGPFRRLYGSYGLGLRVNLGGALVLRLDYGKKYRVNFRSNSLAITGFKQEPKTFTQFFFGWDF